MGQATDKDTKTLRPKVNGVIPEEKKYPDGEQLPSWILAWFYATAIICTWDASFIVLRPHSLPGGQLAWIFYAYKYYVTVDQRYMDTSDAFVFAQSLLNYAEVLINVVTIVMHYRASRHTTTTAFMVSVMTMWKTVLYFLMFTDLCTGSQYRQGNTAFEEFFLVVLPNGVWILIPTVAMVALWGRLIQPTQEPLTMAMVSSEQVQDKLSEADSRDISQRSSKREVTRGPGSGLVQGSLDGDYSQDLRSSMTTGAAKQTAYTSVMSSLTRRQVARQGSNRK